MPSVWRLIVVGDGALAHQLFNRVFMTQPDNGAALLIGLATYNEIDNLPKLIEEIRAHQPDADILVVDDNSPDGTGKWCDDQRSRDSKLFCIHRSGKLGLGTATIECMRYAMDHDYSLLINMDADFSHHPRFIASMLERIDQHPELDVVIGSRYVTGGAIEGWPRYRRWMSRAVNTYARLVLRLRPNDCSGSFRCYRVSKLREVQFGDVQSRGYSFFEEILWHLQKAGAHMQECPITFVDRVKGQTKINIREAIGTLTTVLRVAVSGRNSRSEG